MTHSADVGPATGVPAARSAVQALRPSLIREVANAGFDVPDVLPFWFGESDRVTPAFIRDAAAAALRDGATFYTQNLGTVALRRAIAAYVSARHGATPVDTVAVTSSGVSALMLTAQLLVGLGDRVVVVTPLWPNLVEIPKILGAQVECVPLGHGDAGWRLDIDRLLAALTPDTRMLFVNSPNNPTGWTMSRDDQRAVLAHCRRHGIWVVADEVYERLAFGVAGAPSFLDIASRDERLIVVNSFSKAWAMTGWRLGWLIAPAPVMGDLSKLVEYNTSCAPGFIQAAGEVALRDGEPFVQSFVGALRGARDHLVAALRTLPGVDVPPPPGAMYLFLRLPGAEDSLAFCKSLVRETGLGLAPGRAFGPEGEGFVRWCYACDPARLDAGVERLRRFLARGAYSPQSQIRVRVWSFDENEPIDHAFFKRRVQRAVAHRTTMVSGTGAVRLVFGEADGLPGLIVDYYVADTAEAGATPRGQLVCQFMAAGVEAWKDAIVAALTGATGCPNVYERSDVSIRDKEGLEQTTGVLAGDAPPATLISNENGVRYHVDVPNGHKTGFYVDQRDNRALVAQYAADRDVLNCFCYTGGFSLAALKGGAKRVVSIDSSGDALALAQQNVVANGFDADRATWLDADAFKTLRRLVDEGERFDLIVLDPPKFAPTRDSVDRAARAYKDINLSGFRLLRPGGLLFTYSCSGAIDMDLFQKIVAGAAADAKVDARILKRLGAGVDHPLLAAFPEGEYLKGLLLQIV